MLTALVAAVALYLSAVRRVTEWPALRTMSFLAGIAVVIIAAVLFLGGTLAAVFGESDAVIAAGGDVAAAYIATQFALYGLKPAGDNGSYLQHVPLVGITTQPATTFAVVPENGEPLMLRTGEPPAL